jgi:hypothetical protein
MNKKKKGISKVNWYKTGKQNGNRVGGRKKEREHTKSEQDRKKNSRPRTRLVKLHTEFQYAELHTELLSQAHAMFERMKGLYSYPHEKQTGRWGQSRHGHTDISSLGS